MQYICMMVMCGGEKQATISRIGERLFLDSGTLAPVLHKLEQWAISSDPALRKICTR